MARERRFESDTTARSVGVWEEKLRLPPLALNQGSFEVVNLPKLRTFTQKKVHVRPKAAGRWIPAASFF